MKATEPIHIFCVFLTYSCLVGANDFPWAEASSYAEPDPELPMASHDFGQSHIFPDPANHNPDPIFPFPNTPFIHPPDPVDKHSRVALPVQPPDRELGFPEQTTQIEVLLPVESTVSNHVESTTEPMRTTLSPLISPDNHVRVTMVVTHPLGVDEGLSSYTCYLSQPDVGRSTLSTGRYSQTRDGGSSEAFPTPEIHRLGGHGVAVDLKPSAKGGFGAFYCQGSQPSKDMTTVVGIFLTSNPKILPSDGRFTKTVSIGDIGVTMAMTLRSPADAETHQVLWRKDGQRVLEDMSGLASITFRQPITHGDDGVYECYYANERNQARHGIQRLIVRSCPAKKWNAPRCTGVCDLCYNGGMCDDVTGRCICPPGFTGDHCEQVCGFNRFGVSCEYRCSSSLDESVACRGKQFCLPDPYGCTCNTGFTGLRCEAECEAGRYGAGCLQACHCASGHCDRFTGQCFGSPSGCSPGWSGVNCQVPDVCPEGYFGPECLNKCHCLNDVACNKMNGRCPGGHCASGYSVYDGEEHCSACWPGTFGIKCSQICTCQADLCNAETGYCNGGCFEQYIIPTYRAGISSVISSRVNVGQTASVNCTIISSMSSTSTSPSLVGVPSSILPSASTVVLYRVSGEDEHQTGVLRLGSVIKQGSETVMFGVDGVRADDVFRCAVVGVNGQVLARKEIDADAYRLPVITNPPVIVDKTSTSFSIQWLPWDTTGSGVLGDPPLVEYIVLYRQNGSIGWTRGECVPAIRTSATQSDLRPHTWYDVSIAGVREGQGGEGIPSPWVTLRTSCQVPLQPSAVQAVSDPKFPRQISVAWQTPEPTAIRCPSGIVGFNIYYREVDSVHSDSGTLRLFTPSISNQLLTGLQVYTKYLVSMSVMNEAGEGEKSEEVSVYSPQEIPPPPIHLTVQQPTKEVALLSWEVPSPLNVNGKIRFYEIQYKTWTSEDEDEYDMHSIQLDDSSVEIKYQLTKLMVNLTYSFKVRTINDVGAGDWCDPVSISTYNEPTALLSQNEKGSVHGPLIGLSIMGVFVCLLLLAGLIVGVAKIRKMMHAQKTNELSTLRDTVAFSRLSTRLEDLKENTQKVLQDDVYLMPIATASITKHAKSSRKPKPKVTTTKTQAQGEDEHKYEYIDPQRFPIMRFAILANENETVIHSYR